MEISEVETFDEGPSNLDEADELARAIEQGLAARAITRDLARVTRSVYLELYGQYAVIVTTFGEKLTFRASGLDDAETVAEGVMQAYEKRLAQAEAMVARRARSP